MSNNTSLLSQQNNLWLVVRRVKITRLNRPMCDQHPCLTAENENEIVDEQAPAAVGSLCHTPYRAIRSGPGHSPNQVNLKRLANQLVACSDYLQTEVYRFVTGSFSCFTTPTPLPRDLGWRIEPEDRGMISRRYGRSAACGDLGSAK